MTTECEFLEHRIFTCCNCKSATEMFIYQRLSSRIDCPHCEEPAIFNWDTDKGFWINSGKELKPSEFKLAE